MKETIFDQIILFGEIGKGDMFECISTRTKAINFLKAHSYYVTLSDNDKNERSITFMNELVRMNLFQFYGNHAFSLAEGEKPMNPDDDRSFVAKKDARRIIDLIFEQL